jgi:hypothetical protein
MEKSENRRVLIGDLMVGLGGLEPPTSPLSVLRSSVSCLVIEVECLCLQWQGLHLIGCQRFRRNRGHRFATWRSNMTMVV